MREIERQCKRESHALIDFVASNEADDDKPNRSVATVCNDLSSSFFARFSAMGQLYRLLAPITPYHTLAAAYLAASAVLSRGNPIRHSSTSSHSSPLSVCGILCGFTLACWGAVRQRRDMGNPSSTLKGFKLRLIA